eukprot:11172373-Lingulodinium_polyedra.AAC.1
MPGSRSKKNSNNCRASCPRSLAPAHRLTELAGSRRPPTARASACFLISRGSTVQFPDFQNNN